MMNVKRKLLIVGAGQYAHIAKETAVVMNCFSQIDFVDDNSPLAIAKVEDLERLSSEYTHGFVAIGRADIRLKFIDKLKQNGYNVATLIHPQSYVSPSASVGDGCIIEPCAVVQANARVGVGCLISAGAVINHNAVIEDGCHIDCNATVAARSIVRMKTKVDIGHVYKSEDGCV